VLLITQTHNRFTFTNPPQSQLGRARRYPTLENAPSHCVCKVKPIQCVTKHYGA